MRYPASEKLEIIRLVEGSHLSARLTLAKLGIPRTTFYRWYDRYLQRGEAGLQDQSPKPKHVWNRVPPFRVFVSFKLRGEARQRRGQRSTSQIFFENLPPRAAGTP